MFSVSLSGLTPKNILKAGSKVSKVWNQKQLGIYCGVYHKTQSWDQNSSVYTQNHWVIYWGITTVTITVLPMTSKMYKEFDASKNDSLIETINAIEHTVEDVRITGWINTFWNLMMKRHRSFWLDYRVNSLSFKHPHMHKFWKMSHRSSNI